MNRNRLKAQIADWLIVNLIDLESIHPAEKFQSKAVRPKEKENFAFAFDVLVEKGCHPEALLQAIGSAKAFYIAPLPSSSEVQQVAQQMEEIADVIAEFEKQPFLAVFDELEAKRLSLGRKQLAPNHSGFGPKLPFVGLPKYLRIRARMYREWGKLCRQKVTPRRDLLERVARLYPLVYATVATGKTRSEQIAVVLKGAAISDAQPGQLRRELGQFKRDCPHAYQDLVSHLRKMTLTSSASN
jgi:hypothetical protein